MKFFFLDYKMNVYTVGLKKEYSIIPLAMILRDLLIIYINPHSFGMEQYHTHTQTQIHTKSSRHNEYINFSHERAFDVLT